MKLFHSHASPFVRKVMVVAHERGLTDRIALLPSAVNPADPDRSVLGHNPLAQVPTLLTEAGEALADSRVICEYLDAIDGHLLFPGEGAARWRALAAQSAADGIADAALLIRYELTARPEAERSQSWIAGQTTKIGNVLDWFEARAHGLAERVDIGTIALACALGYLDLRFADMTWREGRPALAAWQESFSRRPSLEATRPPAG